MSEHIFPGCPQTRRENAVTDTCCVALWVIMYGTADTKRQKKKTTKTPENKNKKQLPQTLMLLQKSQRE